MNKMVKCPACNETYNLDLDKYGGKKIKCKKCQAIMSVPTAAQAQDEFEIVEDVSPPVPTSPAPPPPAPMPAGAPPSILQRHRMASQRGAVNIALLQRNEASREVIRQAFLDVHGSEAARLPDSIVTIIEAEEELDRKIADSSQEKLAWIRDVLARALASDAQVMGPNLTKKKITFLGLDQNKLHNEGDEDAYAFALSIIGRPIREMPAKKEQSGWEAFKAGITGKALKDEAAREAEERAIKIDTIKAALEVSENTMKVLLSEKAGLQQDMDKVIAEHSQRAGAALGRARGQMQEGKLAEATQVLQDLLKTAPVKLLGQVLIALSQCTYLSGNPSNAARHIQDAICFGASAPVNMDEGYNDLWAKASSGLPKT